MEFDKVIRERCSIRKFSEREVEEDKLLKILEAGRMAPTAKNIQPIKIYVIKDTEKLDKATRCRYGAKTALLVCGDTDEVYSNDFHNTLDIDCSIVATHMMLEATNIGVDNIWIDMFDRNIIRNEFNIPDNIMPVCLLPIGYRDDSCPTSPNHDRRKELSELVEYK